MKPSQTENSLRWISHFIFLLITSTNSTKVIFQVILAFICNWFFAVIFKTFRCNIYFYPEHLWTPVKLIDSLIQIFAFETGKTWMYEYVNFILVSLPCAVFRILIVLILSREEHNGFPLNLHLWTLPLTFQRLIGSCFPVTSFLLSRGSPHRGAFPDPMWRTGNTLMKDSTQRI